MLKTEMELYEIMAKKSEVLENIRINTKVQIRFIKKRKLKGLHRLLDERAQYLQELAVLNEELNRIADNSMGEWTFGEELNQMGLAIHVIEREIVSLNSEALKAANIERDHIVANLCNVRTQKNMIHCYNPRWIDLAGKKLNQKG